jgi:hypothetical protein
MSQLSILIIGRAGKTGKRVGLLDELFTVVLDGRNSQVMGGVEEALGRPSRAFSDYVRAAAATGVWRA